MLCAMAIMQNNHLILNLCCGGFRAIIQPLLLTYKGTVVPSGEEESLFDKFLRTKEGYKVLT